MLPVDIGVLKPTQLATLKPGTFFFHGRYPDQALAVVLEKNAPHLLWLDLSGKKKFILGSSDRGMVVYPMLSDPSRIALKVDMDSLENPTADHTVGLLVVNDEGAAISCRWEYDPSCKYFNVVPLNTWAQSNTEAPRFRFTRWTLGYTDAEGSWVDLVSS